MGAAPPFIDLAGEICDPLMISPWPHLIDRILLSSGYSLDGETQQVMAAGARGFIQKPYRLAVLSHKVAEILGTS